MRRSGFLLNDLAPTSVVLSGTQSYVVAEAPVRVTVKGLAAGQSLPVEVRIFAFDASRRGSQIDYWAPLYRDGAPVTLSSTNAQIIERIPGEYRIVAAPNQFGAPLVIAYDEVWDEADIGLGVDGFGYGISSSAAGAVGRFMWNDAKPAAVPSPQSTIFTVTDHPIALLVSGLGPTDALQIETRVVAPNSRRPSQLLEYWAPLSRNGRPVVLGAGNTQLVEYVPGTYRVVVPGPRPFGQDLIISVIDHRPLNADDVRRVLFEQSMIERIGAVVNNITNIVAGPTMVQSVVNAITSNTTVMQQFITSLVTELIANPPDAQAVANAITADPVAAQIIVNNIFADPAVASSVVTNIAGTIAADPALAQQMANAISSDPAAAITILNNQAAAMLSNPAAATNFVTALTSDPASASALINNLFSSPAVASLFLSTDAGNELMLGADNRLFYKQALTTLTYDPATTSLTYKDEAGNSTVVNLGALTSDIYVNGAAFDPAALVLTLTDNSAGTPDVTVNLGALLGKWTPNGNGTYTYDAGNGTTFTLDIRATNLPYSNTVSGLIATTVQAAIDELASRPAGISTDAGNQLVNGTDGRPFYKASVSADVGNDLKLGTDAKPYLAETVTTLAYAPATHVLTYTDEAAAATAIDLSGMAGVSADVGNDLKLGTDAKPYLAETVTTLAYAPATHVLTYTDEAAASTAIDLSGMAGVSADAGNSLTNGTDGKPFFKETVTTFTYDPATTSLTYKDEAGNSTVVNLGALTSDIFVNGASFDPAALVLTLTDNNAGTPDVTVNLGALLGKWTPNGDGTYTYDAGNGSTFTLDIRATNLPYSNTASGLVSTNVQAAIDELAGRPAGISTDAGNQLVNGTDGRPFYKASVSADAGNDLKLGTDARPYLAETVTTLAFDPVTKHLTYTDEAAAASSIDLSGMAGGVSTDVGNQLTVGTDAKPFFKASVSADAGNDLKLGTDGEPYLAETVTTLAYDAATKKITYTDEAAAATVLDLSGMAGGVSADAGNQLTAGTDGRPFFIQALTTLAYNAGTSTLTYKDEAGNNTVVDLSALAADIYVNGATFDPAALVLKLTDNNAGTPDVTVNLGALLGKWTPNGDGTYTYDAGNGTTFTMDLRAANLPYSNATSGLTATKVQGAIDELASMVASAGAPGVGTAPATSNGSAVPTVMTGAARSMLLADPDGWLKFGSKNVPYWN